MEDTLEAELDYSHSFGEVIKYKCLIEIIKEAESDDKTIRLGFYICYITQKVALFHWPLEQPLF